jgi:peroxiredoxin
MTTNKNGTLAAPAGATLVAPPVLAALPGEPAPAFEGRPLTGRASVRLDDYRGKVVLLDFWASWCPACRRSLPWLERLHRAHSAAGLEVLSVNVDERPADARRFLARHRVGFPVIDDSQGAIAALYDAQDLPSSYLIDRAGLLRLAHRGFGPGDGARLRQTIGVLLREP